MRAVKASFLLLQITAHLSRCSSSSVGRGVSSHVFGELLFHRRRVRRRRDALDALRRLEEAMASAMGGARRATASFPAGEEPEGDVGVDGSADEVNPAAATNTPADAAATAAPAAAIVSGVPATLALGLAYLILGMSSLSFAGSVVQLAMVVSSGAVEEDVRSYLGKVVFRKLFLVGQSSFWIKTIKDYGLVWVLFPALLVVVNNTMAYVFGVLLGKHELLPRLVGFVGPGISALAIAAPLLQRMVEKDSVADLRKHALVLALYVSLVSPLGGFLASAVKRAHGAKDFGTPIPGHGVAADLFDCRAVTAPFVYLYLKNFLAEPGSMSSGSETLLEEPSDVVGSGSEK